MACWQSAHHKNCGKFPPFPSAAPRRGVS
jgi:hypothetical protein